MKSLQHVLWRGALALSLVAIGVGSGIGMPPAQRSADGTTCDAQRHGLLAGPVRGPRAQPLAGLALRAPRMAVR